MIAEHSLVVLDCNPPHEKLDRGDVGTVVHVYRGGRGYEVEFVDGGGRTVALVTVGLMTFDQLKRVNCSMRDAQRRKSSSFYL
jgi:hypothetical protein